MNTSGYGVYGNRIRGDYSTTVGWNDLIEDGEMVITLRESVLDSDQAIIAAIAHEMHEINSLRRMLSQGRRIRFVDWVDAICSGRSGNLHDEAWDAANELLDRIFGRP